MYYLGVTMSVLDSLSGAVTATSTWSKKINIVNKIKHLKQYNFSYSLLLGILIIQIFILDIKITILQTKIFFFQFQS